MQNIEFSIFLAGLQRVLPHLGQFTIGKTLEIKETHKQRIKEFVGSFMQLQFA